MVPAEAQVLPVTGNRSRRTVEKTPSDAAISCPEHNGRRECSKNKRRGGRCHAAAIAGLDACPIHAGEKTSKAKARGQANLMRAAFAEISATEYVDPGDVLLWAVTVSSRQVSWLRSLIHDRVAGGQKTQVDADEIAILVRLEQDERHSLTRAAKMALDAGIAERHVRLAERTAEQLVAVLRAVVSELGHDASDPKVQEICRRQLTLVAGGAA